MPALSGGQLGEKYVLRLQWKCRCKELIVIFAAFVHLTTHEASTHIGFGTVTLVCHNPAATHKDVTGHGPHVLEGVNLPDMLVALPAWLS